MSVAENIIAIGRSRYLYDAIRHLDRLGYRCRAIITEEAYEEYDVKHQDFEKLADCLGARFFKTKSINTGEISQIIKDNNIRVAISANWKYTLAKEFLDLFEYGIINFHLGNLPDYKGNATVNWTIINGEKYINGNIHKMAPELDAGDVICRRSIPITADLYIGDILKKAEQIAPLLYEEALEKILKNPNACELKGTVQGLRCYPRLPEDSQVNWHQPAEHIHRLVRASSHPYQGAFSFLNSEKVTIWKASTYQAGNPFLAMPGHVISVNKITGNILVACQQGILEIQEIEFNKKRLVPAALVKSIRVRFKYKTDV